MYKQKTWKRAAVLFAGPGMNFIIGLVLIYGIAARLGAAEPAPQPAAYVSETSCVAPASVKDKLADCTGDGPAAPRASSRATSSSRSATPTCTNFQEMVDAVRKLDRSDPVRHRARRTADHHRRRRRHRPSAHVKEPPRRRRPSARSASRAADFRPVEYTQYNPVTAVPGTVTFTGDLAVELGKSLAKIPTKIGALVHSIGGGERDPETPISVVGATIIGGDTVRARAVRGVLVLPGPAELRAGRDQPGAAAAVRRRPHRGGVCSRRSAI